MNSRFVLFILILAATSLSPCLRGGCSTAHAAEVRALTLDQALAIAVMLFDVVMHPSHCATGLIHDVV